MSSRPAMTVVVTIISEETERLAACLAALEPQVFDGLEVLVPYDDPVADVVNLQNAFPWAEFIHADGLDTWDARAGASREHHDTIRTLGLRRARGRVVAMLEDVCIPGKDWCQKLLNDFELLSSASAIGGGIVCANPSLLNRAVCVSEFWRYQEPVTLNRSAFASDVNIGYRSEVLESLRDVWSDDFHEKVVNDELQRRGGEIWLSPNIPVSQDRGKLTWREALRERFVWGRSYGGTRIEGVSTRRRLFLSVTSPVLPLLLSVRIIRDSVKRGYFASTVLPILPGLFVLLSAWSVGEFVGYVSGRKD